MHPLLSTTLLGAVEGLTEFLPISSSGHLILTRFFLNLPTAPSDLAVDAILQLGSMVAVIWYFRKDLSDLVLSIPPLCERGLQQVQALSLSKRGWGSSKKQTLLLAIIIGTIPAVIFGLLLENQIETSFRAPSLLIWSFLAGSILMALAEWVRRQRNTTQTLSTGRGFLIGLFQTLALVPGISRSGATISGGLLLGFSREEATRFSFLLSVPIIVGSGLLKVFQLVRHPETLTMPASTLIVGFLISAIVSYFSIAWLIKFLKTHSLLPFIVYRVLVSLLLIVLV